MSDEQRNIADEFCNWMKHTIYWAGMTNPAILPKVEAHPGLYLANELSLIAGRLHGNRPGSVARVDGSLAMITFDLRTPEQRHAAATACLRRALEIAEATE